MLGRMYQGYDSQLLLVLGDTVAMNPEAKTIGYMSSIEKVKGPLDAVAKEFRNYLTIMGKETADTLLEHWSYNIKIELKDGEAAPCGPRYPLLETELETIRIWLKEMLPTGKIRRSTSPAGLAILFNSKPYRRGLRLCVDYRTLEKSLFQIGTCFPSCKNYRIGCRVPSGSQK